MSPLNTGISNCRNVASYSFGPGTLSSLHGHVEPLRKDANSYVVCYIDCYFQSSSSLLDGLTLNHGDLCRFVDSSHEPTTSLVDEYVQSIRSAKNEIPPVAIIGIGGGVTMDIAKAVSNLLTNPGRASDYQGWDLVKFPGIYKIGIPTISGTGCEATRTCVMTNMDTGLKLGMNSDFTVFDRIILDPDLSVTVPTDQYFYTGMDAYIHCIESMNGSYRNAIGDAFSQQALALCRGIFMSDDMQSDDNRASLMAASYLGGCAIASSYVGVIHPFSAGLSVVLGTHHCIANCIVMMAMKGFYPQAYQEFIEMLEKQEIRLPSGIASNLSDAQYEALYNSTIIHEKPLTNALGDDFSKILTKDRVIRMFQDM